MSVYRNENDLLLAFLTFEALPRDKKIGSAEERFDDFSLLEFFRF